MGWGGGGRGYPQQQPLLGYTTGSKGGSQQSSSAGWGASSQQASSAGWGGSQQSSAGWGGSQQTSAGSWGGSQQQSSSWGGASQQASSWGGSQQTSASWGGASAGSWGKSTADTSESDWQGWGKQSQSSATGRAAPSSYSSSVPPDNLTVSGCTHATIGHIVRGHFNLFGENHGRPTFKKDSQTNGLDVMLYFWDERDGPALCGWWFGPKVGGDQVWAFHSAQDMRPPSSGWMVPFNGALDSTMKISYSMTPDVQDYGPTPSQAGAYGSGQGQWGSRPQPSAAPSSNYMQQQMQQQQQQQQQQRLEENRRQQEDMRRRMEENKKKVEEANRRRREEQEAENKRKMEEQRKRMEELAAKKAEEDRIKREMMEKRQVEMRAMTEVRKIQQKVRVSKLETFEEARAELQDVLEREMSKLGDKAQAVTNECEAVVAQVQKRVDAVKEMRKKEEEKKVEEERLRKENEVKAVGLLEEMQGHVAAAEKALESLKERSEAFAKAEDLNLKDVEITVGEIKEAGAEADKLATVCSEFYRDNHNTMKLAPNGSIKPAEEAEEAEGAEAAKATEAAEGEAAGEAAEKAEKPKPKPVDTKQWMAALLQKIGGIKREAIGLVDKATKTSASLVARAAAREEEQKVEATFKKYDKNNDGMLSQKELLAYAKGEFKFDLPEESSKLIWEHYTEKSLKHGETGVPLANFELTKVAVGIAREMQRERKRRADREVAQKRLEEMKAGMTDKIKTAAEAVSEADQAVAKTEEDVKGLQQKSKAMRVAEMKAAADETKAIISKAQEAIAAAQEKMNQLKEEVGDEFKADLLAFIQSKTKMHESKLGRMDGRVKRTITLLERFRQDVSKKRAGEVEKLRAAALKVARYAQQMEDLSDEALFQKFDTSNAGSISKQDFLAFFESAEKVIKPLKVEGQGQAEGAAEGEAEPAAEGQEPAKEKEEKDDSETIELPSEDLEEVFAILCLDGEETLSLEAFVQAVPQYLYVVKQTALTDGVDIKESKTKGRLEMDDIVRVLKGPVKENATGVMRHYVKTLKDDSEGWISAVGNAGTTFLKEVGRNFKVTKETILTESLDISEGATGETPPPKLKVGEVVEVRHWPMKEDKSGLLRMKVSRKSDGSVGWVTMVNSQGAVQLKAI